MASENKESYVRIRKKIYEVRKRSLLSTFENTSEYVSNFGIYAGSGENVLNQLMELPIIEESKEKYPISETCDPQEKENYGWKWIAGNWRHDGADAWRFASGISLRRFPLDESKWAKGFELWHTTERRIIYRYAIKKNITKEEIDWLLKHNYDVISVEDNSFKNNITELKASLNTEFKKVQEVTVKPNILLLGGSGAGKSSLVNAVFGKSLAEIGNGLPVTQSYSKFEDPDIDVVIYDSKGIEHGSIEEGFLEDTKNFFMKLRKNNELTGHIHVVWYVIDLTQARFQPFEADFCRNHLKDIPVIFVFNKADAVSKRTRDIMIKTVADFNLPNCHGLFATVAQCKNFDRKDCPECGSLRIRKRVKEGCCTILCKECSKKTEMHQTEGIEELSRATISVLPKFVQSVFVSAQKSTAIFQEGKVKSIALKYASISTLSKERELLSNIKAMVDEITNVYNVQLLAPSAKVELINQISSYYFSAGMLKRFRVRWLSGSAPALVLACALEVSRNCIIFKEELASYSLEEDVDESLIVHQVLANLKFQVDKEFIRCLVMELQFAGTIENYLNSITIDGNFTSYLPFLTRKAPEERKKVEIVLHPYQKRKQEENTTTEIASPETAPVENHSPSVPEAPQKAL